MMLSVDVLWDILVKFVGPIGVAFLIGIIVGWGWKPRWASLLPDCSEFTSSAAPCVKNQGGDELELDRNVVVKDPSCSSSTVKEEENGLLTDKDLKHLWQLVERKDGGPPWKHMMDRSTPNMFYQAWQRDPETGPPQYCSKTVYENATPELIRDFYWDDDFRLKWDDMLLHAATLEEFPTTGTSVVHWTRKFPFFCSDREYTIARRIWGLGRSYYCVTKGVPYPSVPRKQKPRRVDLYYSSWFIQPVESKIGSDQPACEVTFFHHEDMGIPWEIAKYGVRQGMWGAARKVERGFRLYQKERASSSTISPHVVMAQMSTKIDESYLDSLESNKDQDAKTEETQVVTQEENQAVVAKLSKFLIIGGAIMLACSIDRGLLTKGVILGVAKRFASVGRQAYPRR
ncbi:START domain, START-like domain protein [Artemisia annua]|uniref:START domain, START-like domain protein n=2 Tax=Artemisia annua TaxID=35608 RepID=A0A2U1QGM6_ARTAN|nr:START domain, START-like domain protein [Artemisia annua]